MDITCDISCGISIVTCHKGCSIAPKNFSGKSIQSTLELKCEITDGFPTPLYNWTTPSKGSLITDGNILQVNNTKGMIFLISQL